MISASMDLYTLSWVYKRGLTLPVIISIEHSHSESIIVREEKKYTLLYKIFALFYVIVEQQSLITIKMAR